jgi:hypothetical protein
MFLFDTQIVLMNMFKVLNVHIGALNCNDVVLNLNVCGCLEPCTNPTRSTLKRFPA